MRTLFLIVTTILLAQQGSSQERTGNNAKKNEIRLNTLYLPAGYAELTYERALARKSALGLAVGGFLGSQGQNYATDILTSDFSLLPYYRYYFGKRTTTGFFIENNYNLFYRKFIEEPKYGVGIGLALGAKFNVKNSWSIGLVAGGGANISQEPCSSLCFPDMYPRLGIAIGKRF